MLARRLALGITCATGFSGLVYEVAWQKVLATLLGSHSEATAAVIGLFLGGLAVGYSLFGRVTRWRLERAARDGRPARLLFVYGGVEAAIGAWALAFPLLFAAARAISPHLPGSEGQLGFALDVALSALLVGPPSVLMGATIPFLTQGLARDLEDSTRIHALVYATNTAGAFAGALCAGFWLVPALGLVGVLVAMGLVNLAAGAALAALDAPVRAAGLGKAAAQPSEASSARGAEPDVPGFASFLAIAGLVGFAMASLQTTLIRLGGLAFGASQFTFSMVVAVFVLCIALGSFAVAALPRIPPALLVSCLWALVALLGLLYPALGDATYWSHLLRTRFGEDPAQFTAFHLAAFAALLGAIGPAVVLSGATLPLLFHQLRREAGELGELAGRLYSSNTLGSLAGALGGGYALLFWLDLHSVYRVSVAGLAVAAGLATARASRRHRAWAAAAVAAALALLAALPAWSPERLSAGLFRNRLPFPETLEGPDAFFAARARISVPFYDDDPTASVAVREQRLSDGRLNRAIATNGKSDGSLLGDYVTMGLAALLPALLADDPSRAFVIGWGTGVTAGELAALDPVHEVVVAEISPAVLRAAPFFEEGNQHAWSSPKLRTVRSDAYRALLRAPGRFGVIVSEPSNPWVTGVEMLFSAEFLEAARDRLAPGGVYAQWFHTYETDAEAVALVLRTYASVFDHVAVWYATGIDLLLLGFDSPQAALDLGRLEERAMRPDFRAGLERCGIDSLPALLAHELLPLGVLHATHLEGPVHTLLHPRLSHAAARAFFAGQQGSLPDTASLEPERVGALHSLVLRFAAQRGGFGDAELAAITRESCEHRSRECIAWIARWRHEVPESGERRALLRALAGRPGLRNTDPGIRALARLHAATPVGGDPWTSAHDTVAAFARYYLHAAPFPRAVLARAWRRCEDAPAYRERCAASRATWEALVGDLTQPGPGDADGDGR